VPCVGESRQKTPARSSLPSRRSRSIEGVRASAWLQVAPAPVPESIRPEQHFLRTLDSFQNAGAGMHGGRFQLAEVALRHMGGGVDAAPPRPITRTTSGVSFNEGTGLGTPPFEPNRNQVQGRSHRDDAAARSSPAKQVGERVSNPIRERTRAAQRFCCSNEPNFTSPMLGGEFGLFEGGSQAAEAMGPAHGSLQFEYLLRQFLNPGICAPPPQRENAGADAVKEGGRLDFLGDELEDLLQAKGHDALQVFKIDGAIGQAVIAGQLDGSAFDLRVDHGRAMVEFELFGALRDTFKP